MWYQKREERLREKRMETKKTKRRWYLVAAVSSSCSLRSQILRKWRREVAAIQRQ